MERNNQQSISQSFTELDTEFDQHLANMKKFVLELQDKKGFFFSNFALPYHSYN